MRKLTACILLPLLGLLAGCGWHSVYGAHDSNGVAVSQQLNQIAIENIPDRYGQELRNGLIDRMYGKGRPPQPIYHLTVLPKILEEDLGIQADATSTRSLLTYSATYTLTDAKGKQVLTGTARSISSFNTLVDEYANLSAKDAATERTLTEVAEQIVNRLSLYFAEKSSASSSAPAP